MLPQQMHLEGFVVFVRHLAHGASIWTVLLMVEHVLSQSCLALKAGMAYVAERMGAKM